MIARAGLVLLAGLAGAAVHELTHVAAAVVLGREVQGVDWWRVETSIRVPEHGPTWRDRAIGAAPLVVGLVALPALVAALSWPALVGWGIYTLGGLPGDLRVRQRYPTPDWWAGVAG